MFTLKTTQNRLNLISIKVNFIWMGKDQSYWVICLLSRFLVLPVNKQINNSGLSLEECRSQVSNITQGNNCSIVLKSICNIFLFI